MTAITQTPTELLNYEIDWASRGLGSGTITASSWSVEPDGCTLSAPDKTDTTTSFYLTGGTPGTTYEITNTITTSDGLTMEETVAYACVEKRFIR